jgi:hypothetical protein
MSNKKNNKKISALILTLMFLMLIIAAGKILNSPTLNKGRADIYSDYNPDQLGTHEALLVSVSEVSTTGSRFKLRLGIPATSTTTPENISLTGKNSADLGLKLKKAAGPYECYDSHNYNSGQTGYETEWINGNLEEFNTEKVKVTGSGHSSSLDLPVSHLCIKYANDMGETDMSGAFVFPYAE